MKRFTMTRPVAALALTMALSATAPAFADGMMKKGMDDGMKQEMAMEKQGMMKDSGTMAGDGMMKKEDAMKKMSGDAMMDGDMKKSMK